MTVVEIHELFEDTVMNTRALYNKVEGYSEDTIYNWKTKRTQPKLGDMLSILYQLNLIKVTTNG
jgi:hypothetical protein